jgi:hypothetical protein
VISKKTRGFSGLYGIVFNGDGVDIF